MSLMSATNPQNGRSMGTYKSRLIRIRRNYAPNHALLRPGGDELVFLERSVCYRVVVVALTQETLDVGGQREAQYLHRA
jgi:hypothetical protein